MCVKFDQDIIDDAGCFSGRWRFGLSDDISARVSAHLTSGEQSSPGFVGLASDAMGRQSNPFTRYSQIVWREVSKDLIGGKWRFVGRKQWSYTSGGIAILEARALLFGLRRVLRRVGSLNSRQLMLCDSMAVVLAVTKGRSSSRLPSAILKQISALLLGTGIQLRVRWLPSEANQADKASRGHHSVGYAKGGKQQKHSTNTNTIV